MHRDVLGADREGTTSASNELRRHFRIRYICAADEARHEGGRRLHVELARRGELFDAPMVEHRDTVRHRQRLALVVRHVDEGDAEFLLQALELDLHFLAQLEVERAQRLIEQQHLRMIDERARQRHALSLPAGELRRPALTQRFELHQLEHLARQSLALVARDTAHARTVRDVLQHGHVREQRVVLEDRVDVAVVGRHVGHIRAVEQHLATIGWSKPATRRRQVVLPEPDGPEHGEELARLDGERHVVDRAHVAVDARDAAELDRRRHERLRRDLLSRR